MKNLLCGITAYEAVNNMALQIPDHVKNNSDSGKSSPSGSFQHSPIMERVKKFISSPLGKRKGVVTTDERKVFGVALDELSTKNADGSIAVPFIVTKICDFIRNNGIQNEGIFRINGNARIVEKLRSSFDKTGDADLEEAADMMAVAGLLKLFLRELPDSIIPEKQTQTYVDTYEEYMNNPEVCTQQFKDLFLDLTEDNFVLLKYLTRFLVQVAKEESSNKMSAMALGIVFGPNVFKCSEGIFGLRQQGVTNQIVCKFIKDYDLLFDEVKKTPPPRPPPPTCKMERSPDDSAPVPSPRKGHTKKPDLIVSQPSESFDSDNDETRSDTPVDGVRSRSASLTRYSDDEQYLDTRSTSPFILDSDGGSSTVTSPILTQVASELVSKTIKDTITDMFPSSDEDTVDGETPTPSPTPAPRRKRKEKLRLEKERMKNEEKEDELEETDIGMSVKDRIQSLEADEFEDNNTTYVKPKRQRPTSTAFELFEGNDIMLKSAPDGYYNTFPGRRKTSDAIEIPNDLDDSFSPDEDGSPNKPVPKPRSPRKKNESYSFDDLDGVLPNLKKSNVSQNQQPSSHKHGRVHNNRNNSNDEDINHNEQKEQDSYKFLNIHQNGSNSKVSPERSPNAGRKPFVPPLDLSTLHQSFEGEAPVLAEQGPSIAYHKSKVLDDDEEALLSPRCQKLDKVKQSNKGGTNEDEHTAIAKQLTKKIQTLKKKIKVFEDQFEEENGYKPSQTDKAAKPDIKKHMAELNKARKELKRIKDEAGSGSATTHTDTYPGISHTVDQPRHSGVKTVDVKGGNNESLSKMEDTLNTLMRRLNEKRKDFGRPEELESMTREQVQDEKLSVQKALLHFEGIHGRPSSKAEKELMRPLYDNYRKIKKILAKPQSPKNKELETVPEGTTIEFTEADQIRRKQEISVHVPIPSLDDDSDELGTTEFNVTRDPSLLNTKENIQKSIDSGIDGGRDDDEGDLRELRRISSESNLHELSLQELLEHQKRALNEKKMLRKVLREFEDEFVQKHGRKVQKEDRQPLEAEYNNYKKVKSKIRLVEALLSKHDPSSTI